MTKEIKLGQGEEVALVDDEDYEWLNQWKWCLKRISNKLKYARGWDNTTSPRKNRFMHRLIMKAKKGQEIDHKNRNGLDNRRCNLRICTRSQNIINREVQKNNSSGYKGVSFRKDTGMWRVCLRVNTKLLHFGQFDDPKEAALAYNKEVIKYFGEFAYLNAI